MIKIILILYGIVMILSFILFSRIIVIENEDYEFSFALTILGSIIWPLALIILLLAFLSEVWAKWKRKYDNKKFEEFKEKIHEISNKK